MIGTKVLAGGRLKNDNRNKGIMYGKTIRNRFTFTSETSYNIPDFSNRYTTSTSKFKARFDLIIFKEKKLKLKNINLSFLLKLQGKKVGQGDW